MRLIIVSSVYQRAESGSQLRHRNIKALSERVRGKIHGRHVLGGIQQSRGACFGREIDSRILSESEYVLVSREVFNSDGLSHLHQRHIA